MPTTPRHTITRTTAATIAAVAAFSAASPAPAIAGTPAPILADNQMATVDFGPTPQLDTPRWRRQVDNNPRLREVHAYSPAMNRYVPFFVISPKDNSVPRPIIYLLNGGDGGEGRANWVYQTDVVDFYKDKNVWVVIPMSGAFSYYTDWETDSKALGGKQQWETFLTKELPHPLEEKLGASDQRAIVGMSMTGTTSLLYAEHQPGFYDAVGSFSGCAETSRGLPFEYLRMVLNLGKEKPTRMWGPIDGKVALRNDALLNAERLRGTKMYISSGTGLAGRYDLFNNTFTKGNLMRVLERTVTGGVIEAATNKCTHDLKAKLDGYGIPADWNFHPTGTHSWGWWQQDLRDSWPTFARAFNMDPGADVPMSASKPATQATTGDVAAIVDAARGESPSPGAPAQPKSLPVIPPSAAQTPTTKATTTPQPEFSTAEPAAATPPEHHAPQAVDSPTIDNVPATTKQQSVGGRKPAQVERKDTDNRDDKS